MNRIYRTVYNAYAGAYVAVSELCRSVGSSPSSAVLLTGAVLSAAAPAAWADAEWDGQTIFPDQSRYYAPGNSNILNILAPKNVHTVAPAAQQGAVFIREGGGKEFHFKGDFTTQGGAFGAFAIGSGSVGTVVFEGDLKHTSGAEATGWAPILIENQYTQRFAFKGDTVLNGTYNYNSGNSSGSAAMYGVVSGSSVNSGNGHPSGSSELYSRLTFNNLTINLADTQQRNLVVNPSLINGIRAIQGAHTSNSGQGSAGLVTVEGKLNMNLYADRGIGIYVSGNRFGQNTAAGSAVGTWATPKVVLNGDADINVHAADGRKTTSITLADIWDSHGIKLGKVRYSGEGAGILESKGNLNINTAAAAAGGGIKILRNSAFIADAPGSSTTVSTKGYALQIGGSDDRIYSSSHRYEQAASHGVEARFKDAVFQTDGTSRDRIVNGSQPRTDLIFVDQGQHDLRLAFSGSRTDLTAHKDGHIINVSGNYTAADTKYYSNTYDSSGTEIEGEAAFKPSTVAFSATGSGSMTGLVTKDTLKPNEGQSRVDGKHARLRLNLVDGFTWNLNKSGTSTLALFDELTLQNGAVLNGGYDAAGGNRYILHARIGGSTGGTHGTVANSGGIITLANGRVDDVLTIDGNYAGTGGAVVKMDTVWNAPGDSSGGNSATDVLHIKGRADGSTQIVPVAGGREGVIEGNVQQLAADISTRPVVLVEQGGGNAFTGTAKTRGAVEVQLAKRSVGRQDQYYWTMKGVSGDIYAPAVSAYLHMPQINAEQALASLRTLHERRSDNRFLAYEAGRRGQAWLRLFGGRQHDRIGRFGFSGSLSGFQAGHDFAIGDTAGGRSMSGLYLAYSRALTRFDDEERSVGGKPVADIWTGNGQSHAVSIGAGHSRYAEDGGYWDWVAQLSYFRNRYQARDGSRAAQSAWGALISVETGRPYCLDGSGQACAAAAKAYWQVEPQAQLVYQAVGGSRFHDGTAFVRQHTRHHLRGRIGLRLAYGEGLPESANSVERGRLPVFYATGNIWHSFGSRRAAVTVGQDHVGDAFGRSWLEVGLGAQLPVGRRSHIYTNWRYERGFGGDRNGWRGDLAWKYTWE